MRLGIAPLLKQNGSIVQQRFRTRKLAEAGFGGQLPPRCGTYKDCRCWIVDGAVGRADSKSVPSSLAGTVSMG
jgi:hypothetical protein